MDTLLLILTATSLILIVGYLINIAIRWKKIQQANRLLDELYIHGTRLGINLQISEDEDESIKIARQIVNYMDRMKRIEKIKKKMYAF